MMHEASLAQGLLKIVLEAASGHDGDFPPIARVKEIHCSAGLLAGFETDTLTECFRMFAEGTQAANAVLTIETDPLECNCGECGRAFILKNRHFICPFCGSDQISFQNGHGLVLKAITVESEDSNG